MAHLIAPTNGVVPMTKEEAEKVNKEKKMDNETRKMLEEHYNKNKEEKAKRIYFTRRKNNISKEGDLFTCPQCHKESNDIRNVCAFCLCPYPKKNNNNNNRNGSAPQKTNHVINLDPGVRLCTTPLTGRCYRIYNEPISMGKATQQQPSVNPKGGVHTAGEDYNDEPDCEEEEEEEEEEQTEEKENTPKEKVRPASDLMSSPYTHFVSIPVGKYPTIASDAAELLTELRSLLRHSIPPQSEELVLKHSSKLHLTLLLLRLHTKEEVHYAKEILTVHFPRHWKRRLEGDSAFRQAVGIPEEKDSTTTTPWMALRGVSVMPSYALQKKYPPVDSEETESEFMNRLSPVERDKLCRKASVLYMKPDTGDNNNKNNNNSHRTVRLLQQELKHCFRDLISCFNTAEETKALMMDRDESTEDQRFIHMTLLNSKWQRKSKGPFNATAVVEAFKDKRLPPSSSSSSSSSSFFPISFLELCAMKTDPNFPHQYAVEGAVEL